MNIYKIIIAILIAFLLSACEEDKEPESFTQTQVFDIDNGVFNTNTFIEVSDAHSGKKISRADVGNNYGFGYSYLLPDSLIGKDISVDVDVWLRTGDISNNCEFIVSAKSRDSIVLWQGCGSKNFIKAPNQWFNVFSTINIPGSLTSLPDFKIISLAHNSDAKSYFDVDDLKITISERNGTN